MTLQNKIIFILFATVFASAQNVEDLSFGTDSTFEIVTWNIEWFPKNGQTTLDYVTEIIQALEVDIFAIQEVDDTTMLNDMLENLYPYRAYYESSWFAGLAYLYNSNVVEINDIYEIYTSYPYWSPFPRSPMVMDCDVNGENVIVINNHYKCCGNGYLDLSDPDDEETRRHTASTLLKEYIDTHFPDKNVIVLGDLNDILTDSPTNNVFQMFLDDADNYRFADMDIAEGSSENWSYPTWPSHIDHLLITNELFDEFAGDDSDIQTIKIDEHLDGGWYEYDQNVSDHRPVGWKFPIFSDLSIDEKLAPQSFEMHPSYPNPFNPVTTIQFSVETRLIASLCIYDISGRLVETIIDNKLVSGDYSVSWNAENQPSGIYFAQLRTGRNVNTQKLMLLK